MKVEPEESTPIQSTLPKIEFPGYPTSPIQMTPSQLIMATQFMASLQTNMQTIGGIFHPSQFLSHWQQASPPSPILPNDQISPVPKSRKLNNNNNIVTSTVTDSKPKRKIKSEGATTASPPSPVAEVSKEVNKDRQFTCNVCNRSFGYKHVLQNHARTHTGEKPFQCKECNKQFTRDHHLKTHMRLHTGERPYHCEFCDRQFVQVANLRRHLRVHTGERPYACEVCDAKFSDSNQLKAHALIHTNEKPFECDRCHSKYRRRHHLLQHKCGASDEEHPSSDISEDIEDEPVRRSIPIVVPPAPMFTTYPVDLPEQTEPEDLSMSTGLHSNSSGDSPLSQSPSSVDLEEDYQTLESTTAMFLKGRLPSTLSQSR